MKYLLAFILLVATVAIAGPLLWNPPHVLPLAAAIEAGACLAFGVFLFDPSSFLAFSADMRKSATCWFTRGAS